jgi:hypothetical protein
MENRGFTQAVGKRTPVNKKGGVTARLVLVAEQEIPDIFVNPIYASTQPFRIQFKGYRSQQGQVGDTI